MIEIAFPESSQAQLAPRVPSPDAVAACQARGTFEFEIDRYSVYRDFPAGAFIQSPVYNIGGYDWCILFFPGGHDATEAAHASKHHVAVTIQLLTQGSLVAVSYDMGLVEHHTRAFRYVTECETAEFDTRRGCPQGYSEWHLSRFMFRCDLHHLYTARYMDDDSLIIKGTLAVLKSTDSPPSDLPMDLGKLLEVREGADVTFKVAGETFPAHRTIVAARSPVFKTLLQAGPMKEDASASSIVINDMEPNVFKAFLHFIYTDSLPSMDDYSDSDVTELMCQILVAAYRFSMDRLMFFCEHIISRSLEVETVSTVLVLADRYHCKRLKDACMEFMISDRMKHVVKTEGYTHLKRNNPSLLLEALEKAAMSRKF
ncbi:hypothetical protein EJB05_09080, partial [Eragrostis curvula]